MTRAALRTRSTAERELYGAPDPVWMLPIHLRSDLVRLGRLGWTMWQSRRVTGWTRGEEAVRLAQVAHDLGEKATIVEIGSFLGCSTILLAGARKLRGSGKVHCVDPFDVSGDSFSVPVYDVIVGPRRATLRSRFERNLSRAGIRRWVEIHQGRAAEVARTWNSPVDMLFLDGDQSMEGVQAAYDAWSPNLLPGAVLALHNSRPGYRREAHDGHARLAEALVRTPDYGEVEHVGSTTFLRKRATVGASGAGATSRS
jgi:predicted O-methyltransferase YrrM